MSWLNPFSVESFSVLATALSLSIFMYWGWDTCLSANEETSGSERTPGLAALLTLLILVIVYVLAAVAAEMYAGIGEEGVGLGNAETSDNVFAALADPVMGETLGLLLFLAVLASSASSLQTTFIPGARTILAMGVYKALPDRFASIHPTHRIPSYATLVCGVGTAIFYTVMTFVSEDVLVDTILSLGLMICFYYGLTAFAAAWYFRKESTKSARALLLKGVAPVLGGLTLAGVFLKLAVDTVDPAYGSGGSIFGLGTVFVLGVGTLALGVVVMFVWQARAPAFFRGETLKKDTPAPRRGGVEPWHIRWTRWRPRRSARPSRSCAATRAWARAGASARSSCASRSKGEQARRATRERARTSCAGTATTGRRTRRGVSLAERPRAGVGAPARRAGELHRGRVPRVRRGAADRSRA